MFGGELINGSKWTVYGWSGGGGKRLGIQTLLSLEKGRGLTLLRATDDGNAVEIMTLATTLNYDTYIFFSLLSTTE